jgi:hypothetical protein
VCCPSGQTAAPAHQRAGGRTRAFSVRGTGGNSISTSTGLNSRGVVLETMGVTAWAPFCFPARRSVDCADLQPAWCCWVVPM